MNSKEIEEEISQLLRSMFEGKISTNNIINLSQSLLYHGLLMYSRLNNESQNNYTQK